MYHQDCDYLLPISIFAKRIFHTHAKDVLVDRAKRAKVGIYGRGWWRYVTFADLADLLKASLLAAICIATADHLDFLISGMPRGVLVADLGRQTTLKAMVGESYRAPNQYEMFYVDNLNYSSPGRLKAEKIRTYELFAKKVLSRVMSAEGSVYAYKMRDMLVFSMTPSEIIHIEIEYKGRKTVLDKSEVPQEETKKEPAAEEKTRLFTWHDDKGKPVDKADVDTLLAGLAKVYCGEYLDDALKTELKTPDMVIIMKGPEVYTLSIFTKTGDKVPALSSQSGSPFVMPDYKLEEMGKSLNKILEK